MLMTKWICQRKPFNKDVGSTNFSRRYVPTKAKNTANGLLIHTKERMYSVDSGTLLHLMGLLSLNNQEKMTFCDSQAKSWIFRQRMAWLSQTRKQR